MPINSVKDAMHEFKQGGLHSGKAGPRVTSRKQAIAIGLNASRRSKGKKVPPAKRALMAGGR